MARRKTKKSPVLKSGRRINKRQGFLGTDDLGREVWDIESVIEKKIENGKPMWCVKWRGWPEPTWEPRESFYFDPDASLAEDSIEKENQPLAKNEITISKKLKRTKTQQASLESQNSTIPARLNQLISKLKRTPASTQSRKETNCDSLQIVEVSKENSTDIALNQKSNKKTPTKKLMTFSDVLIPSDLDTEYLDRNRSHSLNKPLLENSGIDFRGLLNSGRKKFQLEEDANYEDFLPKPNTFIRSFDNPLQEFICSEESSRSREDISAIEHFGKPEKKLCKEREREPFSYTINKIDKEKRMFEVSCFENTRNELFFTKWLDIEQTTRICPKQAFDALFDLVNVRNCL